MATWIEDPQGRQEVEKVTQELKLPIWKPNYKGKFREFWHELWEKIEDAFVKLKASNEGKEPSFEKNTGFNKPFGTVSGTVLEGDKFGQITGKDFGGILNVAGQKIAGKAYFDNNTKKLYICKNNNSDISANVNNYIPFDSHSILERLENLMTLKKEITSNKAYFTAKIYTLSNLILIEVVSLGKELKYLDNDYADIGFNLNRAFSSITGNSGTAGQLVVENNKVVVHATDSLKGLSHSFYGQIITMLSN